MNALCDVQLQGFQKQRPLVTEGVIHALSTDVHDMHQLIRRRGGKALPTKDTYRFPKRLLLIELLRSNHGPLSSRLSPRLCDVSAVDGETGPRDEARFFRREVGDEAGDLRYITHSLQRDEWLNQLGVT